MKKWLKYFIHGESLKEKAADKIDSLEKKAEQELPKKVNKEVKRHYLIYILGSLLILALVGYFAFTYAKDAKKTKRQQDLLQQQINTQAKQIEDAKKGTTTTPAITTTPTTTSPTSKNNLMSCKINSTNYGNITKSQCDQLLEEARKQSIIDQANGIIASMSQTNEDIKNWEGSLQDIKNEKRACVYEAQTDQNSYRYGDIKGCDLEYDPPTSEIIANIDRLKQRMISYQQQLDALK